MTNLIRINNPQSKTIKLPLQKTLKTWINFCLDQFVKNVELDVDFVDQQQSRELNKHYRHKDKPTNILSFPLDLPRSAKRKMLGNLVICLAVVEQEALEQQKTFDDHLAHLLVHGCLHLLGYDHENDKDAAEMEALEIELLAKLGIKNPYE